MMISKKLSVIWKLLKTEEKKNFIFLIFLSTLLSVIEVAGIVTVYGFVDLISNPEKVDQSQKLVMFKSFFSITDNNKVFLYSGLFVIFFLIVRNIFIGVSLWINSRFGLYLSANIASRLLAGYLKFPFHFFTNNNSAVLLRNINSESLHISAGFLIPLLNIFSSILVFLAILTLLINHNPLNTISICTILGLFYLILFKLTNKVFNKLGEQRLASNKERYQYTNQLIIGIKEIKVLGRESFFLEKCKKSFFSIAELVTKSTVYPQVPRLFIELIIFSILILTVLLTFLNNDYNIAKGGIENIALYGFAAYRLMPYLNTLFLSLSKIKLNLASVNLISKHLTESSKIDSQLVYQDQKLKFDKEIVFKNVDFSYEDRKNYSLKSLNLKIKRGLSVAFVGKTGVGKSTIINLLIGLYFPHKGSIRVDGTLIEKSNIRLWQRNIGFVPQEIYISDDSILNNIALGIERSKIDLLRVKNIAKQVNLDHFIESELPLKYNTNIGERGTNISGGQKQRIGIARALYHNPELIIFDEATSSLDTITEKMISETIQKLSKNKTVIFIAHRISTVQHCEMIYVIENGQVVANGNYKDLLKKNNLFRNIALK